MMRVLTAATMLALTACAPPPEIPEEVAPEPPAAPSVVTGPTTLPHPFTAEEIRDEWQLGFHLVIRRRTPEGATLERWQVVEWDEGGAAIEYQPLDEAGEPAGQPRVERATWTELRDHATFEAAVATREAQNRATPLGLFSGWLYTVKDPEAGTVTELFFADDLPGAPIAMRVTQAGATLLMFEQVDRGRGGTDPHGDSDDRP